ncbi:LysR family transcriptional regulator, partial [Salmonella enterica subsp. salamae]|nr:LysR family transcriptional regulator [Salmonella enterica subsp. salamae]
MSADALITKFNVKPNCGYKFESDIRRTCHF